MSPHIATEHPVSALPVTACPPPEGAHSIGRMEESVSVRDTQHSLCSACVSCRASALHTSGDDEVGLWQTESGRADGGRAWRGPSVRARCVLGAHRSRAGGRVHEGMSARRVGALGALGRSARWSRGRLTAAARLARA